MYASMVSMNQLKGFLEKESTFKFKFNLEETGKKKKQNIH